MLLSGQDGSEVTCTLLRAIRIRAAKVMTVPTFTLKNPAAVPAAIRAIGRKIKAGDVSREAFTVKAHRRKRMSESAQYTSEGAPVSNLRYICPVFVVRKPRKSLARMRLPLFTFPKNNAANAAARSTEPIRLVSLKRPCRRRIIGTHRSAPARANTNGEAVMLSKAGMKTSAMPIISNTDRIRGYFISFISPLAL